MLNYNHGAKGGDWFGEAKKGENYGWKILGWGGTNYSGTKIGPKWKPGFTKAIQYWVPSIGASAITIYKGKEFSEWDGDALIASLRAKSLIKLDFQNLNEVKEEIIFKNKIDQTDKLILATKAAGPARKYLRNGENSFVGKNLDEAIASNFFCSLIN